MKRLFLLHMTSAELLAAADRLQVSLDNLAILLGLHRTTMFRYASGELEIPQRTALAVAALEQRMAQLRKRRKGATATDLARDLGVELKSQQARRR